MTQIPQVCVVCGLPADPVRTAQGHACECGGRKYDTPVAVYRDETGESVIELTGLTRTDRSFLRSLRIAWPK